MIAERFQVRTENLGVNFTSLKEKSSSDFRLEYGKNISDQALLDDVVSYLGEYRFSLPQYSYDYVFSQNKLRDPHRNDSMEEVSQRAIDANNLKGRSSFREQMEKRAFQKLDQMLLSAKTGDTIIWQSPPGPKEEGYGDYGFFFLGKVGEINGTEKKIKMKAIRIERPTIAQASQAASILTSKEIEYSTAEECLGDPHVLAKDQSEEYVLSVLNMVFSFQRRPEEQEKFERIIREMYPLISDFIQSAKDPLKTKAEKRKEFNSLENYALHLKEEYGRLSVGGERMVVDFKDKPRLSDIVGTYGSYEPPKVAGSCPGDTDTETSTIKSNNPFSKGSFLSSLLGEDMDYEFDQDGPCKKCNAIEVKCGPCGICKACDLSIRASQRFGLN